MTHCKKSGNGGMKIQQLWANMLVCGLALWVTSTEYDGRLIQQQNSEAYIDHFDTPSADKLPSL